MLNACVRWPDGILIEAMTRISGWLGVAAIAGMLGSCQAPLPVTAPPDVTVLGRAKVAKKPKVAVDSAADLRSVTLPDLFDLMQKPNPPLLCDARMGMLYSIGHIPGAISLPAGNLQKTFADQRATLEAARDAGRRLVFYCVDPNCPDARKAAAWVARQGFSGIWVYEGGMHEWKEAGMPVE